MIFTLPVIGWTTLMKVGEAVHICIQTLEGAPNDKIGSCNIVTDKEGSKGQVVVQRVKRSCNLREGCECRQ